jgi:hypothetical protein
MNAIPKPGEYVRVRDDARIYEVVSYSAGAGHVMVTLRHPYRTVSLNDIIEVVTA